MPGIAGMLPLDQAPRLLTINDEVFTKNYRAFGTKVGENLVAGGGNDSTESSFDALALASRQPFREDANRALILITDADPHIPDLEVKSTAQMIGLLHEAGIDQLHLVIRNEFRDIYTPLQAESPGSVFDLEEAARKKGAFAELLPVVSREIARITIASQPPPPPSDESQAPPPPAAAAAAPLDPPESSKPPPVPPAPAAHDLPEAAPPPVLRGVQSRETFAAESSGRLLVAIAAWTAAITAMIALALCAGQHYYLRRGWLPAGPALRGWLGGLLAGLAGGAAGQLLYQAAPGAPAGEAIFRVLGWTLLGSMAGFVLAFFVPNLRSYRGMLGGAAGGAAGALAFLAAALALRDQPGGDAIGRVLAAGPARPGHRFDARPRRTHRQEGLAGDPLSRRRDPDRQPGDRASQHRQQYARGDHLRPRRGTGGLSVLVPRRDGQAAGRPQRAGRRRQAGRGAVDRGRDRHHPDGRVGDSEDDRPSDGSIPTPRGRRSGSASATRTGRCDLAHLATFSRDSRRDALAQAGRDDDETRRLTRRRRCAGRNLPARTGEGPRELPGMWPADSRPAGAAILRHV